LFILVNLSNVEPIKPQSPTNPFKNDESYSGYPNKPVMLLTLWLFNKKKKNGEGVQTASLASIKSERKKVHIKWDFFLFETT
jgi:hypothetical protein